MPCHRSASNRITNKKSYFFLIVFESRNKASQQQWQFSILLSKGKLNVPWCRKRQKKRKESWKRVQGTTVLWEPNMKRWIEIRSVLIYCYFLLFNQITLIEAICIINHMQKMYRMMYIFAWESQKTTTRGWRFASLMHIITDQQVKNHFSSTINSRRRNSERE